MRRGSAASGGSDVVERSIVYDAQIGSAGPDLSPSQVAKWGQTRTPTTVYAVFGLDHPVAGTPATNDWPYAELYYSDAEGYGVNSAEFGAGQWLVSVSNFDKGGKNDFNLEPDDVDAAVADATSGIVFDPYANSSVTRFVPAVAGSGGYQAVVAANSLPLDAWSAPFTAVLQDGTTAQVRRHTHFVYDEGAPAGNVNAATGAPYMLATTVTTGVTGVADTSTDPTSQIPDDLETISVVKYGYDPSDGSSSTGATSGWTLSEPTTVTTVLPGGTDITRKTSYDATGQATAESEPGSSGSDAGTLVTIPYTAGTNTKDAACGGHPEWVALTCWTGPAAAPEAGADVPDSRTTYNRWLEPVSKTETSGVGASMVTRTTSNTYFPDGRLHTTAVTVTGLSGSTSVARTKALYSGSLLRTGTARLAADGSVSTQDVETLDLWGRRTKYLNNNVDNSNYAYVPAGSPGAGELASLATPKGSYTFSYDGVDANGAIEHRGLRTGMTAPGVGSFSGAYDKSGGLVTEAMPGGVTRISTFDELGRQTGLRYTGDVVADGVTGSGTWLAFGRSYDSAGRAAADWSPAGASTQPGGYTRGYLYDRADRLAQVTDSSGTSGGGSSCTTRAYAFDVRGNRTGLASSTASDCTTDSPATKEWTFDGYSRQLTGAGGTGGYVIDPLGRATSIPASDVPSGGPALSLSYFDNDLVRSIAQGSTTTTFTIDSDSRRLSSTTASGSTTSSAVNHYVDSTGTPAWVVQTSGGTTTTSTYVHGLDDSLVASVTASVASLQLTDMTNATVATVPLPAAGHASSIGSSTQFDEFGNALSGAPATGVLAYGWKGGYQRALSTGGLSLFGLRLYDSATGRFTSRDSVQGGNENAYNYPNDPVNAQDLDGQQLAPEGGGPVTLRMIGKALGSQKGVYYIKDSAGKKYVGKTVNAQKRMFQWANSARYKNLQVNSFEFYKLKVGGDALDLQWLEQEIMDKKKIDVAKRARETWNKIRAMTVAKKQQYEATRGIRGYSMTYRKNL